MAHARTNPLTLSVGNTYVLPSRPEETMTKQTLAGLLCAIALAGCASTTYKKAEVEFRDSNVAYGAVVAVKPLDVAGQCEKGRVPAAVCSQPADFEQANVAVLHSSRMIAGWVFVPKAWHVQYGAIVKLDPKHTTVATELAADKPRRGCTWTGYDLDKLTGKNKLALVGTVATGLLILPPLVTAMDDSFHEGGVECDGWTFRKLLHYS
jgi:hypothetical protein